MATPPSSTKHLMITSPFSTTRPMDIPQPCTNEERRAQPFLSNFAPHLQVYTIPAACGVYFCAFESIWILILTLLRDLFSHLLAPSMNDISARRSEIICSSSCYVDVPYFGYACSLYSCFFLTKFIDIETSVIDMSNDNQNGTTIMSYATSMCQNGGSSTSSEWQERDEGSRPARLEPLTVCFFFFECFFSTILMTI